MIERMALKATAEINETGDSRANFGAEQTITYSQGILVDDNRNKIEIFKSKDTEVDDAETGL